MKRLYNGRMDARAKQPSSARRSPASAWFTLARIERDFASEWILVGDPDMDAQMHVLAGRVLFHSRDRDEVYRQAIRLKPKRFALLFTGRPPGDAAIVLCGRALTRRSD